RSFLTAEGEMYIDQITKLYKDMHPSLHTKAATEQVDIEAFMYSFLRLPPLMQNIRRVIMAQTDDIFHREGYKIEFWKEVEASARRRKIYYDGHETLAVFINSVTDLDDIVCLLTAFQIEWNKMHEKLKNVNLKKEDEILKAFQIDEENWDRIKNIWDDSLTYWLEQIKEQPASFEADLLCGSY